jgi:hypothetical protein
MHTDTVIIEIEGTPQQIEDPYFVDGMPNRSDVRSDTSKGSLQDGIPLRLILRVYEVDDIDGDGVGSCSPLKDTRGRHLAFKFARRIFRRTGR